MNSIVAYHGMSRTATICPVEASASAGFKIRLVIGVLPVRKIAKSDFVENGVPGNATVVTFMPGTAARTARKMVSIEACLSGGVCDAISTSWFARLVRSARLVC